MLDVVSLVDKFATSIGTSGIQDEGDSEEQLMQNDLRRKKSTERAGDKDKVVAALFCWTLAQVFGVQPVKDERDHLGFHGCRISPGDLDTEIINNIRDARKT